MDHQHDEMEKMAVKSNTITAEERSREYREYWRHLRESEGFDFDHTKVPRDMSSLTGGGMMPYDCEHSTHDYPYPVLVKLYAKLGLHRYNMLEGTSFELAALVKFNMSGNCVASYYMTFLAHDPAAGALQKTFQVRIDEKRPNRLDLAVSIARIKDKDAEVTNKRRFVPHFDGDTSPDGFFKDGFFKGELPDWPSDDALNDGKRFYVVKESEWQATGWIFLYLELVICARDRYQPNGDYLSKLEIMEVVIETNTEDVEPLNEKLKAKSVNVYIMFKGLAEADAYGRIVEIGEHVERKAVVRRVMDEHTGALTLMGNYCVGKFRSLAPCDGGKKQSSSSKKRPRGSV